MIVDDHHVVREALTLFIQRAAPDIVVTAANSIQNATEKLALHPTFDIILLDYKMPDMNGLSGLSHLRAKTPDTKIAILSGDISATESLAAIDRGACGVIMKSIRGTGLITALRQIMNGEILIPSGAKKAARAGANDPNDSEMQLELGHLTPREFDCIKMLIRGSANREIAESLSLAEVTVKLHLHSAYKKMGARNRSDAVRIAMLKGMAAI